MPIAQTLMKLPTRSKIVLGVSALLIIGVLFFMLRLASAPSYTLLSSGMDPADAGKVTAALDEQGIGYELRANGTSVAVEKAQVGPARIALSSAGVSAASGGQDGFELFDEQKLGASDFQQKVTYQRALEGEIARTVQQVDGVSGAQVQLVLPEDSLFADEETAATAAVMLAGDSSGSSPAPCAASRSSSPPPSRDSRPTTSRSPTARASCSGRRATEPAAAPAPAASRPRRRATSASCRRASTRSSPRRSAPARPASRSRPTSTSTRRASSRSRSTASPSRASRSSRPRSSRAAVPRRRRYRGHRQQHPAVLGDRRRRRRRRGLELQPQERDGRERRRPRRSRRPMSPPAR